jgi:NADH-quinone oxidoreductase subunit C
MSQNALKKLKTKFKAAIVDSHERLGNETAIVAREKLVEVCQWLAADDKMAFDMLSDITAVDYQNRQPRYEVVYHLYSTTQKHRLRLRVPVEDGQECVPSVSGIWRAANWGEREVYDMFGIRFEGHVDMRRILLYDEFVGHPLRKDYPVQKSQPRMDLRSAERDAVEEFRHFYQDRNRPA